jgi:hypothetical protein
LEYGITQPEIAVKKAHQLNRRLDASANLVGAREQGGQRPAGSKVATSMKPSVIVWDLETVPDLAGFAAANDLVGKSDIEVREVR